MSSDVLLEEFEVRPTELRVVVEIFNLGYLHLGLRVHLPDRTHKFVSRLIPFSNLGWTNGLILVLIRNI